MNISTKELIVPPFASSKAGLKQQARELLDPLAGLSRRRLNKVADLGRRDSALHWLV